MNLIQFGFFPLKGEIIIRIHIYCFSILYTDFKIFCFEVYLLKKHFYKVKGEFYFLGYNLDLCAMYTVPLYRCKLNHIVNYFLAKVLLLLKSSER